jgi:hypothetical protein
LCPFAFPSHGAFRIKTTFMNQNEACSILSPSKYRVSTGYHSVRKELKLYLPGLCAVLKAIQFGGSYHHEIGV